MAESRFENKVLKGEVKMANEFRCPKCGSVDVKPAKMISKVGTVSSAVAGGAVASSVMGTTAAGVGGVLGSIVPGVGTAVGLVAGAMIGRALAKSGKTYKCPKCGTEFKL